MTVEMYHGQFCRNPLHPGPCKGWKSRVRNTSTGRTAAEETQERREARKQQPTTPESAKPKPIVKPIREIGKPSRTGKADFAIAPSVMEKDWRAHNNTLTPEQESAVRRYSGSWYTPMNELLRGQVTPEQRASSKAYWDDVEAQAQLVQESMAPAPRGTKVFRGMRTDALGLGSNPSAEQIQSLVGQVLVNDAFTSTSVNRDAAFSGGVHLQIEVPKGSPTLWMNGNSGIPTEQELLLAAGSKMRIDGVDVVDTYYGREYRIRARLVP